MHKAFPRDSRTTKREAFLFLENDFENNNNNNSNKLGAGKEAKKSWNYGREENVGKKGKGVKKTLSRGTGA